MSHVYGFSIGADGGRWRVPVLLTAHQIENRGGRLEKGSKVNSVLYMLHKR